MAIAYTIRKYQGRQITKKVTFLSVKMCAFNAFKKLFLNKTQFGCINFHQLAFFSKKNFLTRKNVTFFVICLPA